MRTIVLVHSAGVQGPREGSGFLVAALRSALGATHDLRCPAMPEPDAPSYPAWRDRVRAELAEAPDGALLVGHSLGGSVLLKCLSEEDPLERVGGLFLVAAPYWGSPGWKLPAFALRPRFAAHLPPLSRLVLFHSRDDDTVPFAHLARYARALPGATVRALDGHGHLYERGCPELIEELRRGG